MNSITLPRSTELHLEQRLYPAYKALNAVQTAIDYGLGASSVLAGTNLLASDLTEPETRISLRQLAQIYANLIAADLPEGFVLDVGRRLGPATYGAYGYAIDTSRTLAAALDVVFAYQELETPAVRMSIDLEAPAGRVHFVFRDNLQLADVREFNLLSHAATVYSFMEHTMGRELPLKGVWFEFDPPFDQAVCDAYFGTRCRFGMPHSAIIFPARWMAEAPARANPITAEAMRRACEEEVARLRAFQPTTLEVLEVMRDAIQDARTLEAVAARLRVSPRTLRRRLAQEGTSFKRLLEDYRLKKAVHLITTRGLSAQEIAFELGYTETSNFRTAFKRWTGLTVCQFVEVESATL